MMTELRIEDIPEDLRVMYKECRSQGFVLTQYSGASIVALIERITSLEIRNTELEAFAKKWGADAPLSERRTLHEASVAYRKAAGIFPNPDGVKAIIDK